MNAAPAIATPVPGPVRDTLVSQSSSRVLAIRRGRWKLIPRLGSGGFSKPRREEPTPDGPRTQLYDLIDDLGETQNVSEEQQDVVDELQALLERLREDGRSRPRAR